jgi:hypothetical protein
MYTQRPTPKVPSFQKTSAVLALAAAVLLPLGAAAQAQKAPENKSVVVEATQTPISAAVAAATASPFVIFGQWLQQVVVPAPAPQLSVPVLVQPFVVAPAPVGNFEAPAVILGQPELPLLGQAAAQASQQWTTGLNYQGLTLSYVVLDGAGRKREIRPVDKGLAPGERFKLRYTTSFDAVTAIDQVVGEPWAAQNFGQVWPQAGSSVASRAGETVELPLEPGAFFQFDGNPNVRYVLNVRHPKAKDSARSNQPAYRQDGARASQYLQLVPANSYPAIGQVIAARAAR